MPPVGPLGVEMAKWPTLAPFGFQSYSGTYSAYSNVSGIVDIEILRDRSAADLTVLWYTESSPRLF